VKNLTEGEVDKVLAALKGYRHGLWVLEACEPLAAFSSLPA
jgi:hypothetical protein